MSVPADGLVAALDIGSNSVRLLVASENADGRLCFVHHQRIATRLLQGFRDGRLDQESIWRTQHAVLSLAQSARDMGVAQLYAFGTSAMRDGANADALIQAAARFGVDIEVISGTMEAEISYIGAAPTSHACLIDIGGGSTECLLGKDGRLIVCASAQIGAVRLNEIAPPHALTNPGELIQIAAQILAPAIDICSSARPHVRCIGLGGTITTAAAIRLQIPMRDPAHIHNQPLDAPFVRALLERLCAMPLDQRRQIIGLDPQRADILPAGLAILCAYFDQTGYSTLSVGTHDVLFGYLCAKCGKEFQQM